MTFTQLIEGARAYLSIFDYDHYPVNFQRFEEDVRPLFDTLSEENIQEQAAALVAELARLRASLPRRAQRDVAFEQKQVLGLFLAPAAGRYTRAAQDFSAQLCTLWCREYPRNAYLEGEYEQIMKGFDANLLGLHLRKSKKR